MDLETQATYLTIIEEEFQAMKDMLDTIQKHITQYPVYTQLAFMKPLKGVVVESFLDATNPENHFLNNYDAGDSAKIEL